MSKIDNYTILFKSLPSGNHLFEYELNHSFFAAVESEDIQEGSLMAVVTVKKTDRSAELNIAIDGIIEIDCDRCLDAMTQEIHVNEPLIVKFSDTEEATEDIVIVSESEGVLNMAWILYEYIVLAIPIMHTHPAGQCNQEMINKYNQYLVRNIDEADSDLGSTDVKTNESNGTDPRWDALKNISNNN